MPVSLNQGLTIAGTVAAATLLPAAIGLVLGRLLAARRGPLSSWWSLALLLVLLPAFPVLLPLGVLRIGLWDQIWMAWFLCAGAATACHTRLLAWQRNEWLLLAGALLLGLVLLEAGTRILAPPPKALFRGPDQLRMLRLSQRGDQVADEALKAGPFPESDPQTYQARTARPAPVSRRVLHVGDSMVFGLGVEPAETFAARLEQGLPQTAHVNAGFVATGLDFYLQTARSWTRLERYDHVFVYLFLGNDLDDLDRRYHFCRDTSLLTYGTDELSPNCDEPGTRYLAWTRLSGSPPPYVLRATSLFSAAARHLSILHLKLANRWGRPGPEEQWRRAGMVLAELKRAMAQARTPLTVVLLPVRRHFEEPDGPSRDLHDRMAALLQAEGIDLLDCWPAFEQRVAAEGISAFFLDRPAGDPHLNAAGHALMAELLTEKAAK